MDNAIKPNYEDKFQAGNKALEITIKAIESGLFSNVMEAEYKAKEILIFYETIALGLQSKELTKHEE